MQPKSTLVQGKVKVEVCEGHKIYIMHKVEEEKNGESA
jgi:hypothetical protein